MSAITCNSKGHATKNVLGLVIACARRRPNVFILKVTLTAISVTTTVERGLLRIVSTVQDKCSQAANCSSNCLAISAARVRPCPPVKTPAGELLRRPTRLLRPEEHGPSRRDKAKQYFLMRGEGFAWRGLGGPPAAPPSPLSGTLGVGCRRARHN